MPSSMYRRRCGRVSSRKICSGRAPSVLAASRMSLGWLCSPASTSSIMNGVHCQIISIITEPSGKLPIQLKWPMPNGRRMKLTMPNVGSSITVFHTSAPATGMTRNGVISRVRTTPRPRNFRSSTRASATPMTIAISTTPTVMITVFSAVVRNWLSWNTST